MRPEHREEHERGGEERGRRGGHGRGGGRMGSRGERGDGGEGRGGRGMGRSGGWQQADLPSADDAAGWIAGRLPGGWFLEAPEVRIDREEILVVGRIAGTDLPEGVNEADRDAAE